MICQSVVPGSSFSAAIVRPLPAPRAEPVPPASARHTSSAISTISAAIAMSPAPIFVLRSSLPVTRVSLARPPHRAHRLPAAVVADDDPRCEHYVG